MSETPQDMVKSVLDHDQQVRAEAVTTAAQVLRRSPGFGRTEAAPAYEVIALAQYILTGRWGDDPSIEVRDGSGGLIDRFSLTDDDEDRQKMQNRP